MSRPRLQPSGDASEQRNVLIATVLIAVIMMGWLWLVAPPPSEQATSQEDPAVQDTSEVADRPSLPKPDTSTNQEAPENEPAEPVTKAQEEESPALQDSALVGALEGTARQVTVDTELYTATFSTKGASLASFKLKKYNQFDQETPVQLIDSSNAGAPSVAFTTPSSHNVDTGSLYFTPNVQGDSFAVQKEARALTFTADVGQGTLQKTYTFKPEEYELDLEVSFENASSFMTQDGYELVWNGGIPFTEGDPSDEARNAGAYARHGGEVVGIQLSGEEQQEQSMRGQVDWTGVKTKYFTAVVMPQGETRGAALEGEKRNEPVPWENYRTFLHMPSLSAGETDTYRLYLGPMEYYKITDYGLGLYGMVDYGWDFFEFITRTLAQAFFIPFFNFLSDFIPSYGIVIILLAITVKTLVYPLTKKSYTSMAKMRELQPRMEEIREKYGDEPQKQQEEMMKLYKETGVNPLGGCLPMLLQYPVLIALWQFLPNSIEIRQASFLWAHDLSAPDIILDLPFNIPFYGDYVAGFTLLMGLAMVVQMRIQSGASSNPQAKMFQYIMPLVLFAIFNGLASGLSLYYFTYNVVSAVQQKIINRQIEEEDEAEDDALSRSNGQPESKSLWDRVMEQAKA